MSEQARHGDKDTGEWGEGVAERALRASGYKILGKRVRFSSREELDLVARQKDVLVFVEVKTRGSESFGRPYDSVDRDKRRAMGRAAVHYLKRLGFPGIFYRFDVVEVIGEPGDAAPEVRHIENAFTLDDRYRLPC
jgi:putative endonuclease